jgi:hypothetical protein
MRNIKGTSLRVAQVGALALGAVALGAFAIGAIAIGRLAIGVMVVRRAKLGSLEIDDLTVRRLRVLETTPAMPENRGDK